MKFQKNGLISIKDVVWKKKEDGKITNGDVEINVGDYIGYDHTKDKEGNPIIGNDSIYISYGIEGDNNDGRANGDSNQTFTLNNYSAGWRVLDVKNGNIRLISSESIGNYVLRGKIGYKYGVEELNNIGNIYGHGKGAKSGKSIDDKDLNNITGYNPQNGKNKN